MRRTILAAVVILLGVSPALAVKIKKVALQAGRTDDNTLAGPVLVPSAPLEIDAFIQTFPKDSPLSRVKSGGVIGGKSKGVPELDLGALLTQALRDEARTMGFESGPGGWRMGGSLEALYYDLRSNGWAIFYYGTLLVTIETVSPEGEAHRDTFSLFHYDPEFSKAPSFAIAEMLVEGAQEILARLNVRRFGFPPHASVERMMAEIRADGVSKHDLECTAVGLSGSSSIVQPLLEVLESTRDENDRSEIVEALARLGDPRIVPVLRERYPEEDEDVRWATLKAMGYLGTAEALAVVEESGLDDRNPACSTLARDLLNPSGLAQPTP